MKKLILGMLAAGSALVAAAPANAAITISLQYNNGAIVQVAQSTPNGRASFEGTFGATGAGCTEFTANCYSVSTTAQGFPLLTQPNLQTTSLQASTSDGSTAGTLRIFITQSGLNPIAANFTSGLTNNNQQGSAISAELATLLNGNVLASQLFTGNDSSSFTSFSNQTGTFSETARYTLNFGAGRGSFNDTINLSATAVPEPATWGLMMFGFGAMGFALRRRRSVETRIRFA